MARYLSFLICCLALLPQLLFSQQSADVVTSVSQERIYLHGQAEYDGSETAGLQSAHGVPFPTIHWREHRHAHRRAHHTVLESECEDRCRRQCIGDVLCLRHLQALPRHHRGCERRRHHCASAAGNRVNSPYLLI